MRKLNWLVFAVVFLSLIATAKPAEQKSEPLFLTVQSERNPATFELSPYWLEEKYGSNLYPREFRKSPFLELTPSSNLDWIDHGFKSMDGRFNR